MNLLRSVVSMYCTKTFIYLASFILIITFLPKTVDAKITFFSPSELEGLSFHSTQFMYLGDSKKMNVSNARLVAADPRGACSWSSAKNKDEWKDNIVMVDRVSHCSPVDQFKTAEKGGALAVVVLVNSNDYAVFAASNYQRSGGVHIGGVEVQTSSVKEYDDIWKYAGDSSVYVNVTVKGDGPQIDVGYYIAFSVLTGSFALVNFVMAVFKLYAFILKYGRIEPSLPQVCLFIEIIGNILRVILSLESDLGQGRGILDFVSITFIQFIIPPCTLITTLMIAFYWDRSLRGFSKKVGSDWNVMSIERWKIPLIIICVLLVLLSLIQATLVALWYGSKFLAVITFIATSLAIFGIAVFFAVKGNKVLKWTKHTMSITEKSKKITKMTYFVVGNTVGLFGSVVFELVLIGSSLIGWIPLLLCLNFISLCQILIFQPYTKGFSSSSGNTSKSGTVVTATNTVSMSTIPVATNSTASSNSNTLSDSTRDAANLL